MTVSVPDRDVIDVGRWKDSGPRAWALDWLRDQRALIAEHARDEAHALSWTEKEARKATEKARRLLETPAQAERQVVLAEIIWREIAPHFAAWYAGRWEPEAPNASEAPNESDDAVATLAIPEARSCDRGDAENEPGDPGHEGEERRRLVAESDGRQGTDASDERRVA